MGGDMSGVLFEHLTTHNKSIEIIFQDMLK
jgi:hypothetical protein